MGRIFECFKLKRLFFFFYLSFFTLLYLILKGFVFCFGIDRVTECDQYRCFPIICSLLLRAAKSEWLCVRWKTTFVLGTQRKKNFCKKFEKKGTICISLPFEFVLSLQMKVFKEGNDAIEVLELFFLCLPSFLFLKIWRTELPCFDEFWYWTLSGLILWFYISFCPALTSFIFSFVKRKNQRFLELCEGSYLMQSCRNNRILKWPFWALFMFAWLWMIDGQVEWLVWMRFYFWFLFPFFYLDLCWKERFSDRCSNILSFFTYWSSKLWKELLKILIETRKVNKNPCLGAIVLPQLGIVLAGRSFIHHLWGQM